MLFCTLHVHLTLHLKYVKGKYRCSVVKWKKQNKTKNLWNRILYYLFINFVFIWLLETGHICKFFFRKSTTYPVLIMVIEYCIAYLLSLYHLNTGNWKYFQVFYRKSTTCPMLMNIQISESDLLRSDYASFVLKWIGSWIRY